MKATKNSTVPSRPNSMMSHRMPATMRPVSSSAVCAAKRRLSRSRRMPNTMNATVSRARMASSAKNSTVDAVESSASAPSRNAITMATMTNPIMGRMATPATMHRMANTLSGRGIFFLSVAAASASWDVSASISASSSASVSALLRSSRWLCIIGTSRAHAGARRAGRVQLAGTHDTITRWADGYGADDAHRAPMSVQVEVVVSVRCRCGVAQALRASASSMGFT